MKVQFLDRERELKYTFKDVLHLRERYSKREFDLTDLTYIVKLGLRRDDPNITEKEIAEIIDMETCGELIEAIRRATGLARIERPTRESSAVSGHSQESGSGSPTTNSGS